jgi:hypothetical protein
MHRFGHHQTRLRDAVDERARVAARVHELDAGQCTGRRPLAESHRLPVRHEERGAVAGRTLPPAWMARQQHRGVGQHGVVGQVHQARRERPAHAVDAPACGRRVHVRRTRIAGAGAQHDVEAAHRQALVEDGADADEVDAIGLIRVEQGGEQVVPQPGVEFVAEVALDTGGHVDLHEGPAAGWLMNCCQAARRRGAPSSTAASAA